MSHDPPFDIDEVIRQFNARMSVAGLKSTRQRDVIVEHFFRLNKHISVEELLEHVRRVAPRIGYATVYRTLRLLVEHRFAEPRQFGDGQTRFDPVFGDTQAHDHAICIDCRRVVEFSDPVVNERLKQIVGELGGPWRLERQRLELYLQCQQTACPHRGRQDAAG